MMITLENKKERAFDYGTQEFIEIHADGKKVGSMNVLHYESGETHIDRIDIDDDEQNKGYGTEALQMFPGAYVVPDNADAARLYERIGSEVRVTDEFSSLDEGFGVYTID